MIFYNELFFLRKFGNVIGWNLKISFAKTNGQAFNTLH